MPGCSRSWRMKSFQRQDSRKEKNPQTSNASPPASGTSQSSAEKRGFDGGAWPMKHFASKGWQLSNGATSPLKSASCSEYSAEMVSNTDWKTDSSPCGG